jgi:DNA-binding transcriptional LysR family regulator
MYREIEIFRAVMLTGSTSRAAEKLDISQPAVSQAIRKLEENAGLKLFARMRGRLLPTQEATALMVDVDQHFTGMEAIAPSPAIAKRAGARQADRGCLSSGRKSFFAPCHCQL